MEAWRRKEKEEKKNSKGRGNKRKRKGCERVKREEMRGGERSKGKRGGKERVEERGKQRGRKGKGREGKGKRRDFLLIACSILFQDLVRVENVSYNLLSIGQSTSQIPFSVTINRIILWGYPSIPVSWKRYWQLTVFNKFYLNINSH